MASQNAPTLAISTDGALLGGSSLSAISTSVAPVVQPLPAFSTLPSLNPPMYFEIVEPQVYRSNKCDSSSFPFLATLRLNTVVYLSYDELSRELLDFFKEKEINVIHLGMKYRSANPWKGISEGMTKEAIEYMLDQRRHPIMVACKTGVHFAGTVIGCLRRLQNWSLTATIDKYRNLASNIKTRFENEQFIELFDVDLVTLPQQLPHWFVLNQQMMEEERIALNQGESFPGERRLAAAAVAPPTKAAPATENDSPSSDQQLLMINTTTSGILAKIPPAYQRYYFAVQGPLTSPSVKFSEKKSIIGDDDDD